MRANKKALSEIVSYVLLIIIAIGISAMVFAFLQVYLPKEKAECPADISLSIQDYTCSLSDEELMLVISNRGLWKVDAAYVRLGLEDEQVKTLITNKNLITDLYLEYPNGLMPSSNPTVKVYTARRLPDLSQRMEIQITPAILKDNKLVVCNGAIISQPIECK